MITVIEKIDNKEFNRTELEDITESAFACEKQCQMIIHWIEKEKTGKVVCYTDSCVLFYLNGKLHFYQCLLEEAPENATVLYQKKLIATYQYIVTNYNAKERVVAKLRILLQDLKPHQIKIRALYTLFQKNHGEAIMILFFDEIRKALTLMTEFLNDMNIPKADGSCSEGMQIADPLRAIDVAYLKVSRLIKNLEETLEFEKQELQRLHLLMIEIKMFPINEPSQWLDLDKFISQKHLPITE